MPTRQPGVVPDDGAGHARVVSPERGRLRAIARWAAVAVYMALIYGGSSQSTIPPLVQSINDKLLHATAYGGLSFVIIWAATRGRLRSVSGATVLLATLVSAGYGWSDEYHQLFVPGRISDLRDLMADVTGAFAVAGLLWAWGIIARWRGDADGV